MGANLHTTQLLSIAPYAGYREAGRQTEKTSVALMDR